MADEELEKCKQRTEYLRGRFIAITDEIFKQDDNATDIMVFLDFVEERVVEIEYCIFY